MHNNVKRYENLVVENLALTDRHSCAQEWALCTEHKK